MRRHGGEGCLAPLPLRGIRPPPMGEGSASSPLRGCGPAGVGPAEPGLARATATSRRDHAARRRTMSLEERERFGLATATGFGIASPRSEVLCHDQAP
jgi:hypothetical protein